MTRYLGIRFEDHYRDPGSEPFRYDHPTVDVDTDRLDELERAAATLDVDVDGLRGLLDPDQRASTERQGGGEDSAERVAGRDRLRLHRDEIEALHAHATRLRRACEAYDLGAIRAGVEDAADADAGIASPDHDAVVLADDVREAVGPTKYETLLAYERVRDLVALCEIALDADVALEST